MIFFKKKINHKRKNKPRLFKDSKIFRPPRSKYFIFTTKKIFRTLLPPLLITLTILFFNSSFFKLKRVECYRLDFPCALKEVEFFTPLIGKNIFFTKVNRFASKIEEANYDIKEIEIKRIIPDKVRVEIIPRTAIASLTSDRKKFFLIDEEGFIFKELERPLLGIPLVLLSEKFALSKGVVFKGKVENILELTLQLKRKLINSNLIKQIGVDTISLVLDQEVIATLSARKSFSEQLDSLQFILSRSKIEGKLPTKIDLRFEKPIVVY